MPDPAGFETGLFLLSPTHCGTGAASGAVDLPIARERHTDHPILPATALKGVACAMVSSGKGRSEEIKALFGPEPPRQGQDADGLTAGALVFTDGRLLAFPARSLQAAFYWVTCPLVVQRWRRARKALGLPTPDAALPDAQACATFAGEDLILEDIPYGRDQVRWSHGPLQTVAEAWARLLPADDPGLRAQLRGRLVCIPDADFGDLVRRCTPVNARVQLTGGKTTDTWHNPDTDRDETGNLWYEETLPSDCLFSALITTRSGQQSALTKARALLGSAGLTQVGGNETVGQGLVLWSVEAEVRDARR